jgi:hypothetical protein
MPILTLCCEETISVRVDEYKGSSVEGRLWMKDMVDQVLKISGCQEKSFFTVRMRSQDRVSRTIPMWKNLKGGRDMFDRRLRAWLWM